MDTGNLVADIVSLAIVASVFNIAAIRKDTPSPERQQSKSEADDFGFFGPNPSESEDEEGTCW